MGVGISIPNLITQLRARLALGLHAQLVLRIQLLLGLTELLVQQLDTLLQGRGDKVSEVFKCAIQSELD
jgi:hypothetical protein